MSASRYGQECLSAKGTSQILMRGTHWQGGEFIEVFVVRGIIEVPHLLNVELLRAIYIENVRFNYDVDVGYGSIQRKVLVKPARKSWVVYKNTSYVYSKNMSWICPEFGYIALSYSKLTTNLWSPACRTTKFSSQAMFIGIIVASPLRFSRVFHWWLVRIAIITSHLFVVSES